MSDRDYVQIAEEGAECRTCGACPGEPCAGGDGFVLEGRVHTQRSKDALGRLYFPGAERRLISPRA